MISRLSSIQVFCCKTVSILWYDASYHCLYVQTSMSSPLHHFSYRRLSVLICLQAPVSLSLFMFLHLIFCCPSSNCIAHAIIKCRKMILISYFPCLAARFFWREDCAIRPLAPLFFVVSRWLLLKSVRQVPPPTLPFHLHQSTYCHLTAFNND